MVAEDALLSVVSGSSLSEDRTFLFSIELNSSRCPPLSPDSAPPVVNDEVVVSSVNSGRKGESGESIEETVIH